MSYSITSSEVKDGFGTSASDADITAYIAVVDQSDACLTANGVSFTIGKHMKVLGVRHLARLAETDGQVISERAVSGASRSVARRNGDDTGPLTSLRALDKSGCVISLVVSNNPRVQFRSVGRF